MAKILLVDDEPDILLAVGKLLGFEGHEVKEVQNSDQVLELLDGSDFDLMISDMRMSPLSGLDVLKIARKKKPGMRVILFTAYHTPEIYKECMKQGASAYLTKPFKLEQFMDAVNRALAAPNT